MAFVASGDGKAQALPPALDRRNAQLRAAVDAWEFVVATETGMLYALRKQNPATRFMPVNPTAVCEYMKIITLPTLRDSLLDLRYEVCVSPEIAARARVPIERMVAIT